LARYTLTTRICYSTRMATSVQLSFADVEAIEVPAPRTSSPEVAAARSVVSHSADQAALAALQAALVDARASEDERPPLVVLASCLGQFDGSPVSAPPVASCDRASLRQARDEWLRRLETSRKSKSSLVAYRVAIDDLLDWSERRHRSVLEEATIVDYLSAYQERAHPAPATYYRRFLLLRRFLRWVSRRDGVPDPFRDLDPPPKPRQERDWLTREEFRRLLDAAGKPDRNLPGLAERDQLTLLALVTTGLRRSELRALEWRDLELDGRKRWLLPAMGRATSPGVNRSRLASPASCGRCATPGSPGQPIRSSAGSTVDACRRRSSPTSSGAPRREPGSRNTSPPIRCAIPPRPGCARSAAIPASSPSTSGTPTSRPWLATPTSTATSSSMPRAGWNSSPLLRRSVLRRTRLRNPGTATLERAGRIRRAVGAADAGGVGAVEPPSASQPATHRSRSTLRGPQNGAQRSESGGGGCETARSAGWPPAHDPLRTPRRSGERL
jgi:hypothetical protein